MRLLFSFLLVVFACSTHAQDIGPPKYNGQVRELWQYVKGSEQAMQGKRLLVVQQSFPYKVNNKNKYAYGNPDFFANTLASWDGRVPEMIYKDEVIKGNRTGRYLDSVAFTQSEREEIKSYLEGNKSLVWTTELLGDVQFVSSSEIDEYYNNYKGDAPEFEKEYFQLSAPLFLKDNTIALFFWGHEGASEGSGALNLYAKRNGTWIRVTDVYSWER